MSREDDNVVSAWATEMGLSLGQVAADQHLNEITPIPELLKLIDLERTIITIDATGTQTAIVEQIVAGKADYVLAVKGNLERWHQTTIAYIDRQMESDFRNCGARRDVTKETSHGREEIRQYSQMPAPNDFPELDRWAEPKSLDLVIRTSLCNGQESTESRYYISSLPVGVQRFANAVRRHWEIENACHWCLDVTFREDESRIRENHLRQTHAWLNRITLSLLKQHPSKHGIAMMRQSCGWNDNFLCEVFCGKQLSGRWPCWKPVGGECRLTTHRKPAIPF